MTPQNTFVEPDVAFSSLPIPVQFIVPEERPEEDDVAYATPSTTPVPGNGEEVGDD